MQIQYLALFCLFFLVSCGTKAEVGPAPTGTAPSSSAATEEPLPKSRPRMRSRTCAAMSRSSGSARNIPTAGVKVQHILIAFAGTGLPQTRSKDQAEQLAAELFASIRAGADFDKLVREHTGRLTHPGIYGMFADQSAAKPGDSPRTRMVAAFGNVGWRLKVGEVGVAGFDPAASPYGWHIVKRIE